MNVLLIAATLSEIEPFLALYRDPGNVLPKDLEIDVLVTGVGLMATTYSLCRHLAVKRPDLIIQVGIAGSFDRTAKLGQVVLVRQELIADMGVVENNQLVSMADMGFIKNNQAPYHNGWLINKNDLLKKIKLKKVSSVSVNQVTTSKKTIAHYLDKYHPSIESMEGAALHYVCLQEKILFLQLRAISNYVGERNKKNWKLKESIIHLNIELTRILHLVGQ